VRVDGAQRRTAEAGQHRGRAPDPSRVFFLDEPTRGLNPVTSADLLTISASWPTSRPRWCSPRTPVEASSWCDRIVFMASGGRLASQMPDDAFAHFEVDSIAGLYRRLRRSRTRTPWSARPTAAAASQSPRRAPQTPSADRGGPATVGVLNARTLETSAATTSRSRPARIARAHRRHVRGALPSRRVRVAHPNPTSM